MDMNSIFNRLDEIEETVMGELKDFQRATVERIDYLYRNGQNRILVSDEVGLGKTLVARGTIAKFAKLRREEGDNLVKVVYICSNATIAEQNLDKLRIDNEVRAEKSDTSRLSMQHLNIFKQENDVNVLNKYIQLIPLTPQTSFKFFNNAGTVGERALIYTILKRVPELKMYDKQLEEIFCFGTDSWDDLKDSFENQFSEVDKKSGGEYGKYMIDTLSAYLKDNKSKQDKIVFNPDFDNKSILGNLISLCKKIKRYGFEKSESKPFIIELRLIFSDISLNKLDPDLIIMDEFQRFKFLLDEENEDTEMGRLVKKFFKSDDLRILMLSATPYKMYSTLDEIDEEQLDEHYSEFFAVMNFLNVTEKERIEFDDVWRDYSIKLKEFNGENRTSFLVAKTNAENAMFKNICRTERITETELSSIVDDKNTKSSLTVHKEDIISFTEVQKLLDSIGLNANVPVDYIKSSPYLMSFMKNYKLKEKIEEYFNENPNDIYKMDKESFWLNMEKINNYQEIPCNNARLDDLMNRILKDNAEKLLWVPPSMPYYPLKGVFKDTNAFSKTLIFSSWEMVPRMISSLVSYEVERKTIGKLIDRNPNIEYFERYSSPRLNFKLEKENPNQMYLFALIYPSLFLANVYDPIDCFNRELSLEEIENEIKIKIENELAKISSNDSSEEDSRWYYLAPLLLDSIPSSSFTNNWLDGINSLINSGKFNNNFKEHFRLLQTQFTIFSMTTAGLGKKPAGLVEFLCDIAIASPAICIYRSYKKQLSYKKLSIVDLFEKGLIGNIFIEKGFTIDDFIGNDSLEQKLSKTGLSKHSLISRNMIDKDLGENGLSEDQLFKKESIVPYSKFATQIAMAFLYRMDRPESIAVIDLLFKSDSDEEHCRNVLKYSKQGNLQAVFDEYLHLLSNGLDKNNENRIEIITNKFLDSFAIGPAHYEADTFESFSSRMKGGEKCSPLLRTHYAVSFIKGNNSLHDTNRRTKVRNAFNSPFRPFVLTSTSIGQEGLDFHNYCRRIVHWNLPSNPIDLEQREGRINRFECLAIRQNIVKRGKDIKFGNEEDIWLKLFEEVGKREKIDGCSDLIPYWGLTDQKKMIKIERIVPMYPFSRDEIKYDRLMKILFLYRLTLGQSRQEQVLKLLFNKLGENKNDFNMEDIKDHFINLSPFYKKIGNIG